MSSVSPSPEYNKQASEYDEPKYLEDVPISTHVKLYRDWRAKSVEWCLEEACLNFDLYQTGEKYTHVIDYMYHPKFSQAFAERIGGINNAPSQPSRFRRRPFAGRISRIDGDKDRLPLADVEYFLESTYGKELERPDCDYLIDILDDIRESAKFPKNVERALQWLSTRKEELPSWPPRLTKVDKSAEHEPSAGSHGDIHSEHPTTSDDTLSLNNAANSIQFDDAQADNPFDYIIKARFGFEALRHLLLSVGLINGDDRPTKEYSPGALRAVIFALQEKGCLTSKCSAASIVTAFNKVFFMKISESHVRSINKSKSKSLKRNCQDIFQEASTMIDKSLNKGT